ncbi:hypothetical protein N007_14885 [Alicyclobacillus acidoterrestris ATCC 49025]|nr:hypothetical protein N007_14885 [Alicyclobacillus acidoterrestris ATCC 49025]
MIKIGYRLISFGFVLLIVAALLGTYIHDKYFFNPLTFRNNDILYLPWKWYTKPLSV